MKKVLLYATSLFFLSAFLVSCEKNEPDPVLSLSAKEQLLTAQSWKVNEYFTQYSQPSAAVSYKIAKPNNVSDLSKNRLLYKTDKTYYEVTATNDTVRGTWKFINNETQLQVTNPSGTVVTEVVLLNNTSFTWQDNQKNVYARMIPELFTQVPTVTQSKLTGKKWMYEEYFSDFDRTSTGLVFKKDKPNNAYDLTKNRVTFNADGSVTEIDERGSSVPGTWQFVSLLGQTAVEVRNYSGTSQAIAIYLDDSSFVWYNVESNRYAKMKLAPADATIAVSARAKLLTGKEWLYAEYFSGYSFPSSQLSYKRDKSAGNPLSLSSARVLFNLDGTYSEVTPTGASISGTWQFLENETKVKTVYSGGSNTSLITQLDSTAFNWNDAANNTYGKMQHSPYTPGYTVDLSKLTGKTWIYSEYFNQYSNTQSTLVYKKEKTTNSFDLRLNTVKFNANGTFNEVNEFGQAITGTWQIINGNQVYLVNNLGGTNTSTPIVLTDKDFMWYSSISNTYGKMIVKP